MKANRLGQGLWAKWWASRSESRTASPSEASSSILRVYSRARSSTDERDEWVDLYEVWDLESETSWMAGVIVVGGLSVSYITPEKHSFGSDASSSLIGHAS